MPGKGTFRGSRIADSHPVVDYRRMLFMNDQYLSAYRKGAERLYRILFFLCVTGFSVLLILLFTNVVSRNFFRNSFAWIDEVSKFIFTWVMFIGISLCIHKKGLIGMEFLTSKLPAKIRYGIQTISTSISSVFFLVLTIYGIKYVFATAGMFSPVLNINYGIVYLCIPICGAASLFFCISEFIKNKNLKKESAGGKAT